MELPTLALPELPTDRFQLPGAGIPGLYGVPLRGSPSPLPSPHLNIPSLQDASAAFWTSLLRQAPRPLPSPPSGLRHSPPPGAAIGGRIRDPLLCAYTEHCRSVFTLL